VVGLWFNIAARRAPPVLWTGPITKVDWHDADGSLSRWRVFGAGVQFDVFGDAGDLRALLPRGVSATVLYRPATFEVVEIRRHDG
jgi:hypothetical protein